MTVKVINTMQASKPLFFILIVLVPISSLNLNSEQQEESSSCPAEGEIDIGFGICIKPEGNFTIPAQRNTTSTECETTDDGKEKCVKKTITNGTFSFKTCNEKGECTTMTKKNEHTSTSESTFPKLW